MQKSYQRAQHIVIRMYNKTNKTQNQPGISHSVRYSTKAYTLVTILLENLPSWFERKGDNVIDLISELHDEEWSIVTKCIAIILQIYTII